MTQVKLTQVSLDEVKVLQNELQLFGEWQKLGFNYWSNEDFYNAIATVDVALRMYFFLRTRIESGKSKFTISFKISDAVVILKCCHWRRSERNDYEKIITLKYQDIIDQKLKSIITT